MGKDNEVMYNLQLYEVLDSYLKGKLQSCSFKVWEYAIIERQIIAAILWLREDQSIPFLLSHLHSRTLHSLLNEFRALKNTRIPSCHS